VKEDELLQLSREASESVAQKKS